MNKLDMAGWLLLVLALLLLGACSLAAATRAPAIIPEPVSMVQREGSFRLQPDTVIYTSPETDSVGRYLAGVLAPATGYALKVRRGASGQDRGIVLATDVSLSGLGREGYTLEATPKRVLIRARKPAGAFYGVQSLRQLLPPAVYANSVRKGITWDVPCVRIKDYPRFRWRGAMIDTARHFFPKKEILKFVDLLAMQKMNSLHLHLTDDQGWRIEIKRYPLLTKIGSRRAETRVGHEGDKLGFDGKPYGGYYTQNDIREIVAYARSRYVNVVPEIEMPGHAQAAIAAYPELGNTGKKLGVWTRWGVDKNIFNVNESTILFLQNVLSEVLELFPSKFIHVGGDEVPKDQWKASPAAQARMKALGLKNEQQLQSYFIGRMDKFLTSRGRRLVGWDEILEGGLAPGAVVMSWRGIKGGIAAAKMGHDVVMAPGQYTYLNKNQAKGPGEPLSIGGYLPIEKVYGYDPVPASFTPAQAKHVLGTQGQLWSEYISTPERLEYMAFPRLSALAEVAWTPVKRKNYPAYLKHLRVEQQRWRELGVNFRPLEKK